MPRRQVVRYKGPDCPKIEAHEAPLSHLSIRKQEDLQRFVALIREGCPAVHLVILFGSYARGDWKAAADLKPDRRLGHASDYDILAVTEEFEP
ncbi:nucleotidyltransferase domain-containing protein [Thiohalomonas denitrificans]|uniref:nucleotidyltransferase domain-containing protein n=1 Tax=Thiohalomonas denitrificans TaxID=415747 RepID=UPI0026EF083E|nr:nucleotidyltransferase domain-containing protein [Thiohalomonas denitrificans]